MKILLEMLMYFQLIFVSAAFHESGHYLLAKYYKLDPKIMIYGQYIAVSHKGTDRRKDILITLTGIITGLIYILIYILYSTASWVHGSINRICAGMLQRHLAYNK